MIKRACVLGIHSLSILLCNFRELHVGILRGQRVEHAEQFDVVVEREKHDANHGMNVVKGAVLQTTHELSSTSQVTRHASRVTNHALIICQKVLVIGVVDSDNLCRSCVFNMKEKVTYTHDEACLAAIPLGRQPVTTCRPDGSFDGLMEHHDATAKRPIRCL